MQLTFKYIVFAVLATCFNMLSQYLVFSIYNGEKKLYFAIFIGTFVGLVIKYYLDKRYIFFYVNTVKGNNYLFLLYALTGVVTTMVFWFSEIFFDIMFDFDSAKYVGAIIGLSIGYIAKYYLDKKYVFKVSNL